ncbi:lysozyme [Paraburkholderia atlantica]|uniref:lysozyme n=1 Tax=Paraburkholderia atlantica TaxID=2654982 RepID=UPI00160F4B05|nr:lysozyme [Paraburkholderia atlantica]MBB5511302.1 lysozyme [Paraburkholderia atlantica]
MPDALGTAITNTNPDSCVTVHSGRLCKPWKISQQGITFIAGWEAFRPHIYDNDGAGKGGNTTIGYGHLVHMGPISGAVSEAQFRNDITIAEARELLLLDLDYPEHILNRKIRVPLYQYEYDALACFVYNLPSGNAGLLSLVNSGHYDRVPAKFLEYTMAGGVRPRGLIKRRRSEGSLFKEGNYDHSH